MLHTSIKLDFSLSLSASCRHYASIVSNVRIVSFQYQNGMNSSMVIGAMQESQPLSWLPTNENHQVILPAEPNYLQTRWGASYISSLNSWLCSFQQIYICTSVVCNPVHFPPYLSFRNEIHWGKILLGYYKTFTKLWHDNICPQPFCYKLADIFLLQGYSVFQRHFTSQLFRFVWDWKRSRNRSYKTRKFC